MYIARDNIPAADRMLERVMSTCQLLADSPGLGPVCEHAPSTQMFPIGSYIVIYRRADDGIEVVHIIHGARDYRSLF